MPMMGCRKCGHEFKETSPLEKCPKCGGETAAIEELVKELGYTWKFKTRKMDFIHGFPVIASFALPEQPGLKHRRIVLLDRGDGYSQDQYVVAFHCYGQEEWSSGHYLSTMEEAAKVFAEGIVYELGVSLQREKK